MKLQSLSGKILLFLLAFNLLVFNTACSTIEKPFFWKLEKDGKTSYLLGTIHYGVPYRNLPDIVTDKISSSNAVYLETDVLPKEDKNGREIDGESYSADVERVLLFRKPEEPEFSKVLSPRAYSYYKKMVSKYGKYESDIDALSPYGALFLIEEADSNLKIYVSQYEAEQMNTVWGLDSNIAVKARDEQKIIGILDKEKYWENLEFRKCFFKPMIERIEAIAQGRYDKYESFAFFENIVDAYKEGNDQKLIQTYNSAESRYSSDSKCLIDERNRNWIPEIENAHRHYAPVFFAVGVAHVFIGNDNLISLLRKAGYSVERVEKGK